MATQKRRLVADAEMVQVDQELSEPLLVISKGLMSRLGEKVRKLIKPTFKDKVAARIKSGGGGMSLTRKVPGGWDHIRGEGNHSYRVEQERGPLTRVQRVKLKKITKGGDPAETKRPSRARSLGFFLRKYDHKKVPHGTYSIGPIDGGHSLRYSPKGGDVEHMVVTEHDTHEGAVEAAEMHHAKMSKPLQRSFVIIEKAKDILPGGLADKKPSSAFNRKQLAAGIKVEMEHTDDPGIASEIARDHLTEDPRYYEKLKTIEKGKKKACSKTAAPCGCQACGDVKKALPKKAKEEKPVKQAKTLGASKKQMGAGGKTRYSYPQENKNPKSKSPKTPSLVIAPLPAHDVKPAASPTEFANQLGVSMLTLTKLATKLGRNGFSRYMRSHLKRFSAKHRLSRDYWGTLYEQMMPGVG